MGTSRGMIVVVDTNVLVSGLLTPSGNGSRILGAIADRQIILAMTPHLHAELERALSFDKVRSLLLKRWTPGDLRAAVDRLLALVLHVPDVEPEENWVVGDPDDDWVIQCAVSARADLIISGDKGVVPLKAVQGIAIQTPAWRVAELHSEPP